MWSSCSTRGSRRRPAPRPPRRQQGSPCPCGIISFAWLGLTSGSSIDDTLADLPQVCTGLSCPEPPGRSGPSVTGPPGADTNSPWRSSRLFEHQGLLENRDRSRRIDQPPLLLGSLPSLVEPLRRRLPSSVVSSTNSDRYADPGCQPCGPLPRLCRSRTLPHHSGCVGRPDQHLDRLVLSDHGHASSAISSVAGPYRRQRITPARRRSHTPPPRSAHPSPCQPHASPDSPATGGTGRSAVQSRVGAD